MITPILFILKIGLFAAFLKGLVASSLFYFILNPLTSVILFYSFYKRTGRKLNALVSFLIDALLPIWGLGFLILFFASKLLFTPFYKREDNDVYETPLGDDYFKNYIDNKKEVLIKKKFGDKANEAELFQSLQIQPYREILEGTNKKLKFSVIDKLSDKRTKESVKLLKLAMEDETYEVRYFANNALERVEKSLFAELDALSDNIRLNPSDYQVYNHRAGLYFDIYYIGLLDRETSKFFIEKSFYDYIYSLQLNPNQSQLYVRITQINLLMNNYADVLKVSEKALQESISDEDKAKVLFYRAEANFKMGNYKEVIKDTINCKRYPINYELIKNSVNWWSNV